MKSQYGVVNRFNKYKGFGFVDWYTPEKEWVSIQVHYKDIKDSEQYLFKGQEVEFDIREEKYSERKHAINVSKKYSGTFQNFTQRKNGFISVGDDIDDVYVLYFCI